MLRPSAFRIFSDTTAPQPLTATGLTALDSTTKLAVACWMKQAQFTPSFATSMSNTVIGQSSLAAPPADGFQLKYTTRNGPQVKTYNGATASSLNLTDIRASYGQDVWFHTLIWVDQTQGLAQFYINGKHIGSTAVTNAWTTAGTRLTVIGDLATSIRYDLSLFDVRVWAQATADQVITAGDVFAKMAMAGLPAAETARYLAKGEAPGRDVSGNANHLTGALGANFGLTVGPPSTSRRWSIRHRPAFKLAAPVAQLKMTTQPSAVASGVANSPSPVVRATTNGVTTDSAFVGNVTATIASGSGTLSGTTTVAAVAGVATFSNLRVTGSGVHTVIFTATSYTAITSAAFLVGTSGVLFRPYWNKS